MRSTALYTIFFISLLTACNSIQYIGIETYNPAEITFPDHVKKVLIVNNAVPQPSDIGYDFTLYGVEQDTCRASADSALFAACKALGETIVDKGFFEDVLLYHDATRKDNSYFSDTKLTSQQVKELCEENEADAIISLDRLLFHMNKNVMAYSEGYIGGLVDLKIRGVIRAYIPDKENPLATVLVTDSIYWAEIADNLNLLNQFLPESDEALTIAGQYIGSKIYPNFVPHWENESRWWYYNGINTQWKEAAAYASTGKWDRALPIWEKIYEKTSGWKDKAKAAANIALAYEIDTRLDEAYNWAQKAYELFEKNQSQSTQEVKLQKLYMEALSQRIHSDKKLNVQFGEE